MKRFRYIIILVILSTSLQLFAQNSSRLLINLAEVVESTDTQNLRAYFTLLGSDDRPVSDPNIDEVKFSIAGTDYLATVSKPQEPLHIVIAIDTSGSIRRAGLVVDVMESAKQAVANAPADTQFAIYSFNEAVTLETGFTSDKALLSQSINDIIFSDAGTCLYDATFDAVNLVKRQGIRGRRAVILFTDGRDEITAGVGDTCSTNADISDVTDAARGEVSIFTIALQGTNGPNVGELQGLSDATNGLALSGGQDRISDFFRTMVDVLSSQLVAEAETCEPQGSPDFVNLTVLSSQSSPISGAINGLEFQTNCLLPTQTPLPTETVIPSISIGPASLVSDQYVFPIDPPMSNAIQGYSVQIRDQSNNLVLKELPLLNRNATSFAVKIQDIPLDYGQVNIVVQAISQDGTVIDGAVFVIEDFTIIRTPTPAPTATNPPTQLSIVSFGLNFDEINRSLKISTDVGGMGDVASYSLNIVNVESGDREYTQNRNEMIAENLTLNESDILSAGTEYLEGEYRVELILRDENGMVLDEADETFTVQLLSVPTPSIFEVLADNPILIIAVLIALIVVVFFYLRYRSSSKKRDPLEPIYGGEAPGNITVDIKHPIIPNAIDQTMTYLGSARLRQIKPQAESMANWSIEATNQKYIFNIGTDDKNDVSLKGGHISKVHCQLKFLNNEFYVIDNDSTNGTYLDNIAVDSVDGLRLERTRSYQIRLGDSVVLEFSYASVNSGDLPTDVVAKFNVVNGIPDVTEKLVDRAPFSVGRADGNDWTIRNVQGISKSHFKLLWENNRFELVDAGSSNGTFISTSDGPKRIDAKSHTVLEPNKIHTIGFGEKTASVTFQYERTQGNNLSDTIMESASPIDPGQTLFESSQSNNPSNAVIGSPLKQRFVPDLQPKLVYTVNYQPERPFNFTESTREEIMIGRSDKVGNHLVISEPNVSTKHARIYLDTADNRYRIKDENSTNGTIVNGIKLSKGGAHVLDVNSENVIQLGKGEDGSFVILKFSYTQDPDSAL